MINDTVYRSYYHALIKGDYPACAEVVNGFLATDLPLKTLYTDLFQRALYEVGEHWQSGRLSVAVEHLATALTENLLALTAQRIFARRPGQHTVLVSCPPDEHHQLGARMVADIFALHGWRSLFLGANTPLDELAALARTRQPDLIALSLAIYMNLPSLFRTLAALRTAVPRIPVIVGGQAFRWGGLELVRLQPGVRVVTSLEELETLLSGPAWLN